MIINSRVFGEVEIANDKIITFESGMLGFEEYKQYTLMYDVEKEKRTIMWLQCVDEPELAFPVIEPMKVYEGYNPVVEDEWLIPMGEVESEEDYFLLTVFTVPADLTKMTVNLKAPIVINTKTMKACQLIVNNDDYPVKYNVYEYIQKMKEEN